MTEPCAHLAQEVWPWAIAGTASSATTAANFLAFTYPSWINGQGKEAPQKRNDR